MMNRALFADFQAYTDGDAEFKKELIGLMINNLIELQDAFKSSVAKQAFADFRESSHKANSTLNILADEEFNRVIRNVKENGDRVLQTESFQTLSAQIIESLKIELQN